MKLLQDPLPASDGADTLTVSNDADVMALALDGVTHLTLEFPRFTDGRAFSQAVMLRRRRHFAGVLRASGDVLVDQLQQLRRCGFDEAVLRADQDLQVGARLLQLQASFYQGDTIEARPHFARLA
jgi:uncharacterized protein (DUF934 family)